PLSPGQQQLWFLDQLEPGSAVYNIPLLYRLEGALDLSALRQALQALVDRHAALRSTFPKQDGSPVQVVAERVEVPCTVEDLSALKEQERETARDRLIEDELSRGFDLLHGPLLRARLLIESERSTVLLLNVHHIVFDGWSVQVALQDLAALYRAYAAGTEPDLPAPSLEFTDYAAWFNQRLAGGELDGQRDFWLEQLQGELPSLELVPDYVRPPVQAHEGSCRELTLAHGLTERLREIAKRQGVTLYMLMLTVVNVLLKRMTGQEDTIIGTPVACRTKKELHDLIGYFVNMLPLRTQVKGDLSFAELLASTKEHLLTAFQHQEYPFHRLVEALNPERTPSRTPIFQTIMTYADLTANPLFGDVKVTMLPVPVNTVKFDIGFSFLEHADSLQVAIDYRTDLYRADTIDRLLGHLRRLLEAIVANPEQTVDRLEMLTQDELAELTVTVNQSANPMPPEACLHQLVEKQAAERPEQLALRWQEQELTYAQLNARANRLAHWLRTQGVGPDTVVVLLCDQSVEIIVGMLGILKAGGAYMPLDPSYPQQRLTYMIEDSKSPVVLTQSRYLDKAEGYAGTTFALDHAEATSPLSAHPTHDPEPLTDGENLMNVLYTSGSTGMPKGVALPHRGVIRLVNNANFAKMNSTEVVLQLSPLNFDGATFEIWGTLCNGGTLVILEKETVLAPKELSNAIHHHGVTTLLVTTPLLNRLIEDAPEALTPLRRLIFGGEVISKPHIKKALNYCRPGTLVHTYGPTENSFTSCYFPIREVDDRVWTIPIGRPVSNTEIYLLDEHLQPVPYGVIGEVYLSGLGLARGYLNDPKRTASVFLPHPFSQQPDARLYKTGDRARRLADGTIEFIGRKDNQVKIRSQRVELGEVESTLRRNRLVQECFVTTTLDRNNAKQLVAYFVPAGLQEEHTDNRVQVIQWASEKVAELRKFLHEQLPEYMVPPHLIALTDLPLNPNGKVNRRELPEPTDLSSDREYLAPTNEVEQEVAAIWAEVLGLERVGLTDNFFDLGGHSLLVVKVHDRIKQRWKAPLRLMDLFTYTTVAALADAIAERLNDTKPKSQGETEAETEVEKTKAQTAAALNVAEGDEDDQAVAIVGMALRFPQANDVYEFWENLIAGRESITRIPDEELEDAPFHHDPLLAQRVVRAGGFVDNPFRFDPSFFGMSEREATLMDPQHRLFLECAWEAIENAGYDLDTLHGPVALYAGTAPSSYHAHKSANRSVADEFQQDLMSQPTFLATRVSYKLNLTGESLMLDTACSTSLVAVHMACQSLLQGQSSYALAGGVSIRVPQKTGYLYEPSFILSPDGHCRAFDQDAQGTVEGNGCGVVLLKRLSDARRDQDPIYAVIRGSAINNDGHAKIGYTAPSLQGQAEVIARAQSKAGLTPDRISYIEAHGTGTKLGDPIEVEALTRVFRTTTDRTRYCALGSVKTNIGHLGSAAGIAGLIKTALALKHKELPPSLHYRTPNPEINFADSPFYVNEQRRPWVAENGQPLVAGVSSFGIGGTNAHVILTEAPAVRTEGKTK
ncbi:MAG TPA: amino acid adenylation domain-containing protein, partial [Bacilli bacterium]|nr:amino acid adenylation domain-containing protein [Bacilli bacterium]